MKKYLIILSLLFILIIMMFTNSNDTFISTKDNFVFLFYSLIPSLLPYMIIISFINELGGLDIIGYLLQFIFTPIFNISGKTSSLIIAGAISGYPLPSALVASKDKLNKEEEKTISIFVFPSLAFLLNQVTPLLSKKYSFIRLYGCFVLGAIILMFLERKNTKEKVECISFSTLKKILKIKHQNTNIGKIFKKCILNSVINVCIISSNVVIFSLISFYLSKIGSSNAILEGVFEFSKASLKLASNGSYLSYLGLITILLFGGVSILMQNVALLGHTNFKIKNYIAYRIKLIIIVILLDILIFF